jgi:hypothetical protein
MVAGGGSAAEAVESKMRKTAWRIVAFVKFAHAKLKRKSPRRAGAGRARRPEMSLIRVMMRTPPQFNFLG